MKKFSSSRFLLFVLLLALTISLNLFAQKADLGFIEKTNFINRDAECNGTGQLKYDDGTFENGYGWNNTVTDGRYVMLFTPPSYPWNFSTFCVALSRLAAGPSSLTFDVVVYDNTGAGGTPGNLVATVPGLVANAIPVWNTLSWYDFDISSIPALASGSYYIGAKWDASTLSGLVAIGADQSTTTTLQPGYSWANLGPWTILTSGFPEYRAMGMRTFGSSGPPVGPGPATNPSPANLMSGVGVNTDLGWTNPAGANSLQVFWGTSVAGMDSVYGGAPITTWDPGTLSYNTTYYWKVNETDGSGTTFGSTWSFTTEQDPNLATIFFDDFEASTDTVPVNFTITNDGGTLVWRVFGAPYPNTYTLPSATPGKVLAADADEGGSSTGPTTLLSTATLTNPLNCSNYSAVTLQFESDWNAIDEADSCYVDVSNDGTTWVNYLAYGGVDVPSTTVTLDISATADGQSQVWIRFKSVQPGWDWWWVVDNILVEGVTPVELSSFTAASNGNNVVLNWSTATETNNQGFEIQRKTGNDFIVVGFVEGYGTTTETKTYRYTDAGVSVGTQVYRLKQIDFNGAFEYSSEVEVEIGSPSVFALEQNYPNPFNPSTKINYSIATDAKVTLKIFDVLGQQVAILVNSTLSAGSHEIVFDASNLNSGVYFYTIEANGLNGQKFTSTKKMILTK